MKYLTKLQKPQSSFVLPVSEGRVGTAARPGSDITALNAVVITGVVGEVSIGFFLDSRDDLQTLVACLLEAAALVWPPDA